MNDLFDIKNEIFIDSRFLLSDYILKNQGSEEEIIKLRNMINRLYFSVELDEEIKKLNLNKDK